MVLSHPHISRGAQIQPPPPQCFKTIPRKCDSLSCRVSTALRQCPLSPEEPTGHLSRDTALHGSPAHLTSGVLKTSGDTASVWSFCRGYSQ